MEENLHCLRKGTRLIGRYTIEGVLGQGGFGITYLGIDELHEKKVAIKEFFPQGIVTRNIEYQDTVTVTFVGEKDNYEKGKERFLKEARTMAKFSKDEGIVKALDFFEINNTAYIVMEYLEGITLKQYLRENQRIAPEDLIELLVPLIESLDEIHSQGMIHRDISPDNIMVLPDGRIKLMDFGAARDYTEFGEKSLSIVLKPGYAPPEQYQTHGIQGPWTDIYALCATMYKCITGENPPDAIERVMDDHLKKISEFGIVIPPQEEAAIIKGMSVSAKDRYQNIKDFCEDLYGGYEETPASENKESEVEIETGSEIKVTEIAEQQKQQYILRNPKVEDDSSTESGKKVTWNCLWFGSYPQSQITAEDGEIYTILTNIDNWNKNGDVIIENTKYHKTEKDYFKYEPIKWRVLQSENGEAFLLSDVILDKQLYNENDKYVTWEKSSLRAWLNKKFIKRAFIDEEREKINITEIINQDNPVYGTEGGNNTFDKIFLLSLSEVSEQQDGEKYGFLDDEIRACGKSDFSKTGSWWWLRSPGYDSGYAAGVYDYGWVYRYGHDVGSSDDGVRPALHLNLSSSNLFSYAGTVSSDGTKNEVPYNTRTRLVQN
ncbi:MAG: protein kinase domain-containing protein [Anaerobutyricum hallii]|uniref:protein kinase domain-containing protein n=1 Tax=Anaerobutyricum hallii TaxID=39488 RepID=UPI003A17A7B2